jgi:succinyl-diaminopimelate desuccinylase
MSADPVALTRELVRCPSVTPAEGGALAFLEKTLKAAGFTVHRMTFHEDGTDDVENLYARIGTSGPNLVLAGHTDVVPPGDEGAWTHPPFAGDVTNGWLYGRGTVDMKGGVACMLAAALDHLAANGGRPRKDGSGSISFLSPGTRRASPSTARRSCCNGPSSMASGSTTASSASRATSTSSATPSRSADAARSTAI